jgi:hypothetical protein
MMMMMMIGMNVYGLLFGRDKQDQWGEEGLLRGEENQRILHTYI